MAIAMHEAAGQDKNMLYYMGISNAAHQQLTTKHGGLRQRP